jgi:hypothetical protein
MLSRFISTETTENGITCIVWHWQGVPRQFRFPIMTDVRVTRDGIHFHIGFVKPLTNYDSTDYVEDNIPF